MKTLTATLALVLALSFNVLFANNENAVSNHYPVTSALLLAPTTPTEATFDEGVETTMPSINKLAPVTPMEADFLDSVPEIESNLHLLAPVTPAEADFTNDTIPTLFSTNLSPITPDKADFTDTL